MSLGKRLGQLSRQAGKKIDIPPSLQSKDSGAALHERLALMGKTAQRRAAASKNDEVELCRQLGGNLVAPGLICLERRVKCPPPPSGMELPGWKLTAEQCLFIDTETSGLSTGSGTVAFLVGIAFWEGKLLCVRQYLISRFAGEADMYRHLQSHLPGRTLVSYNGLSFDVPLLQSRTRLSRIEGLDWSQAPHLDLLHPVRRAYKSRWDNCRLTTVEKRLLNWQRGKDLPGSEAPRAWQQWLQRGETSLLKAIVHHNHLDLHGLAQTLTVLPTVYQQPQRRQADVARIAAAWCAQGEYDIACGLIGMGLQHYEEAPCLHLARCLRRADRWNEALSIWQRLAAKGSEEALVCLAKYQEHRRKDAKKALFYSEQLPDSPQHERRKTRLQRRLKQAEGQQNQLLPADF